MALSTHSYGGSITNAKRARAMVVVLPINQSNARAGVYLEIEQEDGYHAGHDDGERRGEALEDVVGILDNDGGDEATEGTDHDHGPGQLCACKFFKKQTKKQ
jgi:hypothetical protein